MKVRPIDRCHVIYHAAYYGQTRNEHLSPLVGSTAMAVLSLLPASDRVVSINVVRTATVAVRLVGHRHGG